MKQKRRQKAAAQQAGPTMQAPTKQLARAQEPESTLSLPEPPPMDAEYDDGLHYDNGDDQYYSDQGNAQYYADENGANGVYADDAYAEANGARKKTKKKRKNKGGTLDYPYDNIASGYPPPAAHGLPRPPPPPPPMQIHNPQDRIWNTSTQEERERIREFWLQLGEEQRKSLVKIEKEAVLKKMKEQQKHSCSCTVCGRKRTAIEEELEVLYDAYYEELEQYASHNLQQRWAGGDELPVPGLLHDSAFLRGSLSQQVNRIDPNRVLPPHEPTRPRIRELADGESEDLDEDELDDEEYSDEYDDEEEEEYSDEYDDDPYPAPGPAQDLFNFGQHLTVKGGILTVADDLLKNDGKKFIEMMEQLAERRMQREEQMQYEQQSHLQHSYNDHNHGPAPEDEEYDDEEDEEYDSQDDYEDEEEEMDHLTEEQRMNEGRRMFQIFAARMFEQRVLTAYREKVSDERSKQLVRELEEEEKRKEEQAQKKARDAAKKKEKKKAQQQAKAEEKAKKDAELQAAEAAKKAEDEKKAEEQRRKKEEQRLKKEAEKKALEEERQRKEQEKQKRQQAERERQQETERKARELKAAEKKAREDQKRKEREEREVREREVREQKAHEDKQRAEKEARDQEASDAADRARRDEHARTTTSQRPQLAKVPSSAQVALPPSLYKQASNSPQVAVATPAIPKAPTPVRPRQASRQGSHGSSPKGNTGKAVSPSQPTNPPQMQVKQILQKPQGPPQPGHQQPHQMQQPHPVMPPPGIGNMPTNGPFGQPPGFNGFPHSQGPVMAGMTQRAPMGQNMHMFPPQGHQVGGQFVRFPHMNGMPPSINGTGIPPIGRGNFSPDAPPGFQAPLQSQPSQQQSQQQLQQQPIGTPQVGAPGAPFVGTSRESLPSHSRQQSGSDKPFEPTPIGPPQSRPAPIQRPSSVKPQEDDEDGNADLDDLTKHLGSKALLDDADDEPELPNPDTVRRASAQAPGMPRATTFGTPAFGAARTELFGGSTWGTPSLNAFGGPPGLPTQSTWGPQSPGQGWPQSPFGAIGGGPQSRSVSSNVARPHIVRRLICDACKHLNSLAPTPDGFHDVAVISQRVEQTRNLNEGPVREAEIVSVCEANRIGSVMNGGGTLSVKREPARTLVKYEDASPAIGGLQGLGLGGEIGSPLQGASVPFGGLGGAGGRAFPGLANSHSNLGF